MALKTCKMTRRIHSLIWDNTEGTVKRLNIRGKKIAILIHINPDGDALGSSLALNRLFINLGHTCMVISPNDFPDFLKWMPGASDICLLNRNFEQAEDFLKKADMIFVVDCNELRRIIRLQEIYNESAAFKVMIDHHPEPDLQVNCMLSDTSASSTAELTYRFIRETGLSPYLDKDVAACLFTGIMTDTGCFSHNSSRRETYEAVATLLDFGIDKDAIYDSIYNNYSEHRMHLLGFGLHEKMIVLPEYRLAYIVLTKEELTRFNYQVGDTEGFVNYPLSIKGICFSVLFMQNSDRIKISFRSKGTFPVNDLARKYFNGGGHLNAAGGESFTTMEETLERFRGVLPLYKEELSGYEE